MNSHNSQLMSHKINYTEVFDWYRIDEMFQNYYEKKRRNLIRFPLEVTN